MKKVLKSIIPDRVISFYHEVRKTKKQKSIEYMLNGNDVYCPICKSSFKKFDEFGMVIKRPNARCHNCHSLERHRLLFLYLNSNFNLFKNNSESFKVLHFAPEKVFYNFFDKKEDVEYTPCDLVPELFNYHGNSKILKVDITKIPYSNETFDFVLCNHVLEHVPDDILAMSELYRIMKQGGNGILQVPIDYSRAVTFEDDSVVLPEDREKVFGQDDHVRIYGSDYIKRLRNTGFIVDEIDCTSMFSLEEIFKYGLMKSEKIYHVKKQ